MLCARHQATLQYATLPYATLGHTHTLDWQSAYNGRRWISETIQQKLVSCLLEEFLLIPFLEQDYLSHYGTIYWFVSLKFCADLCNKGNVFPTALKLSCCCLLKTCASNQGKCDARSTVHIHSAKVHRMSLTRAYESSHPCTAKTYPFLGVRSSNIIQHHPTRIAYKDDPL